jgi:hypothetical protein
MFRVEVDGLLLGQMLQAMQQQWRQQAVTQPCEPQQQVTHVAAPIQQGGQQIVLRETCSSSQAAEAVSEAAGGAAAAADEAAVAGEAVLVLRMLQSLTGARTESEHWQWLQTGCVQNRAAWTLLCFMGLSGQQSVVGSRQLCVHTTHAVDK